MTADAPHPDEAALQSALDAMAPRGVRLGCRLIRDGDEAALLPDEARSIPSRHSERLRASGAARLAARRLLREAGLGDRAVPRGASGEPIWPAGWTGSLAHDETMALAALGRIEDVRSLGVDVEPREPLPEELLALVVGSQDRLPSPAGPESARLVFSAKEAVYKAVFPLDRRILDYEDIAVNFVAGKARTRTGHAVRLVTCVAPRIVTLAIYL